MLDNLNRLLSKTGALGRPAPQDEQERLKEGENRFVSVLFADISGFTDMSESLDPDLVQALIDQIMLSFSERVIKYGGYVDKYEGDRIMAHFGSTKYSEQNARRAVHAGLELIEVITLFNHLKASVDELSEVENDLAVRVGINTGLVATGKVGLKREGDFTIYGDAVNLASRMEENGIKMRVMLPDHMKQVLEDYFYFESFGEIEVKGKSKPIKTWLVQGIKTKQVSRCLSKSKLVGRQSELHAMGTVYSAIRQRTMNQDFSQPIEVVSLSAPAGMGKTRLVSEFCRSHLCENLLLSEVSPVYQAPYSSFKNLLQGYFKINDETQREQALEAIDAKLSLLSTCLEESRGSALAYGRDYYAFIAGFPSDDFDPEQKDLDKAINQSLLLFLQALAVEHSAGGNPLIVVFDDLHFCDEASLSAINFILRNISQLPTDEGHLAANALIIVSWRSNSEPVGLIPANTPQLVIDLKELNESQIREFVSNELPELELPEQTLEKLIYYSAGNPYYLEEWIASLQNRGESLSLINFGKISIPVNVVELILSRLTILPPADVTVLQQASAIGLTFQRDVLRKLHERLNQTSPDERQLERICEKDFIQKGFSQQEEESYLFKHALLHHSVYNTLLRSNRVLLHRIIAEIIEERFGENLSSWYFVLADHYFTAGIKLKSLHYLQLCEQLSYTLHMNSKLVELCDKILCICEPYQKQDISIRKAVAYLDMGYIVEAQKVLQELNTHRFNSALAHDKYVLAQTRIYFASDSMEKAKDYLLEHIAAIKTPTVKITAAVYLMDIKRLCGDIDGFLVEANELLDSIDPQTSQYPRLENIIGLFHQNRGDYTGALEYFERALAHSEKHKQILRYALHNKANALRSTGKQEEAISALRQLISLARYYDDEAGLIKAYCDMGSIYMDMGDFRQAEAHLQKSETVARRSGSLKLLSETSCNQAVIQFKQERLVDARITLNHCFAMCRKLDNQRGMLVALDLLGDILYTEGKPEQAARVYHRNLERQKTLSDIEGLAHTFGNLANLAADEQDYPKAESYYRQQQEILAGLNDVEGEAKAWFNWAIIDEEKDDIQAAITKLERAKQLFQKGGFSAYLPMVEEFFQKLRGF